MKGFICNDVAKDAEWPSTIISSMILLYIADRKIRDIYFTNEASYYKPDKKTKQWWGKCAVNPTWYNAHMYAHHVMRQIIEWADRKGDAKLIPYHRERIHILRRVTFECQWKPELKKIAA